VEKVKVQNMVKVKKQRAEGMKIFTTMSKKNSILWNMTPCSMVKSLLPTSC
jgi:hypothetical protein